MKKWILPAVLVGLLLLGTLAVLGSFFITELFGAFGTETTAAGGVSSSLENTSTAENVSQESSSEESTSEETTREETTREETTKKETVKKDPVKNDDSSGKEPVKQKNTYKLTASHAFVYNQASDKFLYTYGSATDPIAPASITKLFTAYVALKYLDKDTVITAGKEVDFIGEDASKAFIEQGQKLTVKACVQGMLIPSGNDAAYILAAAAGRKIAKDTALGAREAVDTFVKEMNTQAKKLGMTGSQFKNPDGDEAKGHYTCMKDLAVIANLSLDNALIKETVGKYGVTATVGGASKTWYNTNKHIRESFPKYYRKTCVGLKTGSTEEAGYCLLSAFTYKGSFLIIGTLGCPEYDGRFEDTLKLYNAFT